jgi:biotin carboxylase
VPRFAAARTPDDVRRFRSAAGCEAVVLKPVDSAGSRGVRIVHGDVGIESALAAARAEATSDEVQVEEFVPGPQISTETLLTANHAETPGFADRNYADTVACHPIVLENGGWMPSALAPKQRAAVEDLVVRAARALGIVRGVAKGDVVVHATRGPMLIEMAARLGGGDFASALVPLSNGVDYLGAALDIALGREPDWESLRPVRQRVVANRYLFAPPGRLEGVRGLELVRSWPETQKLALFVRPGEVLPPITHHGARSGVFVLAGDSRAQLETRILEAYAAIELRIDGIWRHAAPPGIALPT